MAIDTGGVDNIYILGNAKEAMELLKSEGINASKSWGNENMLLVELKDSEKAKSVLKSKNMLDTHHSDVLAAALEVIDGTETEVELESLAEIVIAGELKQLGPWNYYFDGSGGEFYGKTDFETFEKYAEEEQGEGGAPFETAIPSMEGESGMHFYQPNEDYPYQTLYLEDVNREAVDWGMHYDSWDDWFLEDES